MSQAMTRTRSPRAASRAVDKPESGLAAAQPVIPLHVANLALATRLDPTLGGTGGGKAQEQELLDRVGYSTCSPYRGRGDFDPFEFGATAALELEAEGEGEHRQRRRQPSHGKLRL